MAVTGGKRAALAAAMIIAVPLGLAACDAMNDAASPLGRPPIAVEPPPGESPAAEATPVARETLTGPVALAPSITGTAPAGPPPAPVRAPVPPPEPVPLPPAAAPPPAPAAIPAAAAAATAPPEGPAGAAAMPPPTPCPAGTTGMWSRPDITGTSVYICKRFPSGR